MIVGKRIWAVLCAMGLVSFALQQVAPAQQPVAPPPAVDLQGDPVPAGARMRLGSVRWRHPGAIHFAFFLADGKQLLTGCSDGRFRVWDAATGKQLRQFSKAGTRPIVALSRGAALAPDGGTLVAQNWDNSISLWDVGRGVELRVIGPPGVRHTNGMPAMAFTPDGKSVVVRQMDLGVRLFNVADGKLVRVIAKGPPALKDGLSVMAPDGNRLYVSADGKTLAVPTLGFQNEQQFGVMLIHDLENQAPPRVVKSPPNVFNDCGTVSPDCKQVAWAAIDGRIHVYDAGTGKEATTLGAAQTVLQGKLLFTADGKTLISRPSNNSGLNFWDVATGKVVRLSGGGDPGAPVVMGAMVALTATADGKTVAEGLTNGTITLWDVPAGKKLAPQDGHEGRVERVAVAPDGKTLVSFGADQTIRRWDLATGKETSRFTLPAANLSAYLSPNGALIAFGARNNEVKVWDAVAGKEVHAIQIPTTEIFAGTVGAAGGLDFTADGKRLAVRSADGVTRIFDAATAKELAICQDKAVLVGPATVAPRGHVVFSGDGRTLVTTGRTPTGVAQICVWDVHTGKPITRFDANRRILALAASPDGRTVASANLQNSISIWDVLSGKECLTIAFPLYEGGEPAKQGEAMMKPPHGPEAQHYDLSFAPDGRSLVVASGDDRLRWIALPGGEIGVGAGHTGPVQCLALAPDGKTAVSGGVDSTALVWASERLLRPAPPPAGPLAAAQVEMLWNALAGEPKEAYRAVHALAAAPQQAVGLFTAKIKPTPGVDGAEVDRLIAALESNDFDAREKACRALEQIGDRAQPALQKVLDKRPALETQQRVERILDQLSAVGAAPPADVLRNLRAVQLLEQAASPEAKQLLLTLANGAPGDRLTRHAEAALKRLEK